MFERIKEVERTLNDIERREEDEQLDILIGRGWKTISKKIREIVLNYMYRADKGRRFAR